MATENTVQLALDIGHKVVVSLRWILAITIFAAFGAGVFFTKVDSRLASVETYINYMTEKTIPKIERMEHNQIKIKSKLGIEPTRDDLE